MADISQFCVRIFALCYRYLEQKLKSHLFQEKMKVSSVTQDFIWRVGSRRLNLEFHLKDGRKRGASS
jgi:hypothetical protein